MMRGLGQDVAVITGAGRGLGAVIAQRLSRDCKVLVTDVDAARVNEVVSALSSEGRIVAGLPLDVRLKTDFERAVAFVTERWGGAGVLVNNAAMTRVTPLFEITPEDFSAVIDVNLRGTFLGCQVFGAFFRQQKFGRIVNIASLAAQNGGAATGAHYAASKGGVVTLTKVFARDLASDGVTVNAISPGPLDVELLPELLPADRIAAIAAAIPVGRLGDPALVAELVALLASPGAGFATGATFDLNGGLYAR